MIDLIVDIGNSACKVAVSQEGQLVREYKFPGATIDSEIRKIASGEQFESIIISSVADNIEGDLLSFFKEVGKKIIFLDSTTPIPIINKYISVNTLGADRIAAAVAAHSLFPNDDCLIFDFGTALTIDKINKNGEFCGGNISLGMATRFKAINHYTKRLPLLINPSEIGETGKTTEEAIQNGVILGIMFEVEGYIAKNNNCIIIFTGGDAIYFAEKLKNPIFVVYNLVLIGLSKIAEFNADK